MFPRVREDDSHEGVRGIAGVRFPGLLRHRQHLAAS